MVVRIVEREAGSPAAWTVWVLRVGFVAFLLVGWFGPWSQPTSLLWTAGNVATVVGIAAFADLVPAARPERLKRVEAAVLGLVLLNLAGGATFALYRRFSPYDLVVHFVAGALVVYMLYNLAAGLPASWLWRSGTPLETAAFAFAGALAVGALWEIFEGLVTFAVPGTRPIHFYYGTVKDLMADTVGALLGAWVAGRTAHHGRVAPEIRRPEGAADRGRGSRPCGRE